MKTIIVGLGVQGKKRRQFAGNDFVAAIDPLNAEAQYKDVREVPLSDYDSALVCLPDKPKAECLLYLLENKKHVLVEKPLWTSSLESLKKIEEIAQQNKVFCYTAYNHRFEPHFIRMKELIDSGKLGKIYHCRLFYGNGTAALVRNSPWRDEALGVIGDLAPHLLDTVNYWFNTRSSDFEIVTMDQFENAAPDHAMLINKKSQPQLSFEMTLLSWRNHFSCDIFAEYGSAHIESLCKWGPSHFTHRERILPSGRPPEQTISLVQNDPTWALEYAYFKQQIRNGEKTSLANDLWIQETLDTLLLSQNTKAALNV